MIFRSPGFLLAFAATVIGVCGLGEVGYRIWLYRKYVTYASYAIATVDYPLRQTPAFVDGSVFGYYPPGIKFTLRQYWFDGSLIRSSYIAVNNLGWISPYDYVLPKPESEFRIAILGDSMTASVNNDVPWPSVVHEELRKAMPHVSVVNLGNPGMNVEQMQQMTLPIAERLGADLVVVNIPIENLEFSPRPKESKRRTKKHPALLNQPAEPAAPESTAQLVKPTTVTIAGIEIPFYCPDAGIAVSGCRIDSVWHIPRGRELSPTEVNTVKREAARLALGSRFLWTPKFFLFSPEGVTQTVAKATIDEQIEAAVDALIAIKDIYKNLIVTINPLEWYFDPATLPKKTGKFIARAREAGIDVVDMRKHLPDMPPDERRRWWNVPYDGHWSDQGAAVYGQAIAQVIMTRRSSHFSDTQGGARKTAD